MEYKRLEKTGRKVGIIGRADGYAYDFSSSWGMDAMKDEALGFGWLERVECEDVGPLMAWLAGDSPGPFIYRCRALHKGKDARMIISLGKVAFGDIAVTGGDIRPYTKADAPLFVRTLPGLPSSYIDT